MGSSSTVIITLSNIGGDDLTVNRIDCSSSYFFITEGPTYYPSIIEPSNTVDVKIIFTPLALGYVSAILNVFCNDFYNATVDVYLSGTGVP